MLEFDLKTKSIIIPPGEEYSWELILKFLRRKEEEYGIQILKKQYELTVEDWNYDGLGSTLISIDVDDDGEPHNVKEKKRNDSRD